MADNPKIHSIKVGTTTYTIQDTAANSAINTLNGADNVAGSVAKSVKDTKNILIGNAVNDSTSSITIHGARKYAASLTSGYETTANVTAAKNNLSGQISGIQTSISNSLSGYETKGAAATAQTALSTQINNAKNSLQDQIDGILGSDTIIEQGINLQKIIQEIKAPGNTGGIAGTFLDIVDGKLSGLNGTVQDYVDGKFKENKVVNGVLELGL